MRKGFIFLVLVAFLTGACNRKSDNIEKGTVSIIPAPSNVEVFPGFYDVSKITGIKVPDDDKENLAVYYFINWFQRINGIKLEHTSKSGRGVIEFAYTHENDLGKEGYQLEVEKNGITILASAPAGFFYGVQSLFQLMPASVYSGASLENSELNVPCCKIVDRPRFGWRGMHLDVSRHFFPVEFIKRYIDLIALHKMNVFHWHLTDDNGWRIEIKKYPELTEVAAWRVDREDMPWGEVMPPQPGEEATYGGFYSQDEIREVIQYAAERHIDIIPEIEMPGHTSEVFAAYPALSCTGEKTYVQPGSYWPNTEIFCAGKEETFGFIEDVLNEVIGLFPSQYIHIGGDEADKTRWESCPLCQKRMKDEGMANEDELQSWFIKRVEKFLNRNGKKMIGWDEILEGGLAPEATVMSWRGIKGGIETAKMGHDVIMCPTTHCYFDYYQAHPDFEPEAIGGFTTLKKVYHFEPVPEALDEAYTHFILGAQGNVWTEYIASPGHAEYMALPRMSALAEVVWSMKENRNWEQFQERLKDQFERFDAMGAEYSRGSWKVDLEPVLLEDTYTVELNSEQYLAPIHYTLDGSTPSLSSPVYSSPLRITQSTVISAALFSEGKLMEYPSVKEIVFHLGTGKSTTLKYPPAMIYASGGSLSLVDGLKGSDDFRDGYWLGFEGNDFDLLIDLKNDIHVSSVAADFYQNTGSWIFLPENVKISLLDKNRNILDEKAMEPESTLEVKGTITEGFEGAFDRAGVRFVRVVARGMSAIPEWLDGAGEKGWLFVDEVIIK